MSLFFVSVDFVYQQKLITFLFRGMMECSVVGDCDKVKVTGIVMSSVNLLFFK